MEVDQPRRDQAPRRVEHLHPLLAPTGVRRDRDHPSRAHEHVGDAFAAGVDDATARDQQVARRVVSAHAGSPDPRME